MTTEIRRENVENFDIRGYQISLSNDQIQFEIIVTVPHGHGPIVNSILSSEAEFELEFAAIVDRIRDICSRTQS
jgi:hypothetical protein